jgi:hypothetical protein
MLADLGALTAEPAGAAWAVLGWAQRMQTQPPTAKQHDRTRANPLRTAAHVQSGREAAPFERWEVGVKGMNIVHMLSLKERYRNQFAIKIIEAYAGGEGGPNIMNKAADEWTDCFGAVASSLCAVHCAVCGLLPVAFAALGVGFLLSHEAEWLLTLVAVLFGCVALSFTWRTHRSLRVTGLLVVGVVGLLASRGLEMGAGHDDHHGGDHHTQVEKQDEHHSETAGHTPVDEHHHAEAEVQHEDGLHALGAGVGVFSGLLLFLGHLLNIRTARRCRDECCE